MSYTEKTDQQEACGFSYIVVRSDGQTSEQVVYRGENAVGKFLSEIVKEEENIRQSLKTPHPIMMTEKDWQNYKVATVSFLQQKSVQGFLSGLISRLRP